MSLLPPIHISITKAAEDHFCKLLTAEDSPGMGLRIFLDQPGSPQAEIGIAFCPQGEQRNTDIPITFEKFTLFVDRASSAFLDQADVDYQTDKMGGQLAINAPNLRGSKPEKDAQLEERITYILNSEINPNLAGHGGRVSLVEITENKTVVLRFGGGCHGCGMVDVTLKHGIEKTLKEHFPEILEVKDVTDHATGANPYYA